MKNGDMPASPLGAVASADGCCYSSGEFVHPNEWGLTKREAFSMAAMQGFCACPAVIANPEKLAGYAVEQADALLMALEES